MQPYQQRWVEAPPDIGAWDDGRGEIRDARQGRERVGMVVFGPGESQTPGVVGTPRRSPHAPAGEPGPGPLISFSRSNLSVAWDPSFASLLELAEACDVPVKWACRTGVCHTCETGLVNGEIIYRPDPLEQPAPGNALICCSQPRGETALDL